MIGMRLHSLIYASNRAVPALGLVYETKVEAFLKEVSQPSAGDLLNMDCAEVCKVLDELWNNRGEVRERLKKTKERLVVLAGRNVDIALSLLRDS